LFLKNLSTWAVESVWFFSFLSTQVIFENWAGLNTFIVCWNFFGIFTPSNFLSISSSSNFQLRWSSLTPATGVSIVHLRVVVRDTQTTH
jgi:hypothetical protein